jgi:hypothetical protein
VSGSSSSPIDMSVMHEMPRLFGIFN